MYIENIELALLIFFQSHTNCVVSSYGNLTKWSNMLRQFVDNLSVA